MNKILSILTLGFLFACGSVDDAEFYDETDDAGLGQVEQAYEGASSTSFQYGTRSASAAGACDKTSSGQVCMVLRGVTGTVAAKKVDWRFTPAHGFTAAEQTAIRAAITALDNTLTTWTFSETAASSAPIQIGKAAASGASSSNNVDAFRSLRWDLPANLTEGPGIVGAYQEASVVIGIDIADINTRGAAEEAKVAGDQGETGKLRTHIVVNSLEAAIGAGTRDNASSDNTYHDRTLKFPGPLFRPLASAGAICAMERFNHFGNGQFNVSTQGNCAD